MKKLLFCTAVITLGWAALLSPADPPTTAPASTQPAAEPKPASREMLAQLQKKLTSVDTLQADFVQEKHLTMLKHMVTIKGTLAMVKPNKVMFNVKEPRKYVIKVDGDEITQWDEDTNKVEVMHVGGDPTFKNITEQIQAWFLGDYKALEKSYDVYLLSEQPLSLRFVPQPGGMISKLVKNIEVTFGEDELHLDKLVVNETTGDSTTLKYSNTRLNEPVAKETWEIPPK